MSSDTMYFNSSRVLSVPPKNRTKKKLDKKEINNQKQKNIRQEQIDVILPEQQTLPNGQKPDFGSNSKNNSSKRKSKIENSSPNRNGGKSSIIKGIADTELLSYNFKDLLLSKPNNQSEYLDVSPNRNSNDNSTYSAFASPVNTPTVQHTNLSVVNNPHPQNFHMNHFEHQSSPRMMQPGILPYGQHQIPGPMHSMNGMGVNQPHPLLVQPGLPAHGHAMQMISQQPMLIHPIYGNNVPGNPMRQPFINQNNNNYPIPSGKGPVPTPNNYMLSQPIQYIPHKVVPNNSIPSPPNNVDVIKSNNSNANVQHMNSSSKPSNNNTTKLNKNKSNKRNTNNGRGDNSHTNTFAGASFTTNVPNLQNLPKPSFT
ncbi:hypothetical protein TPHA_0A05880 [Tetrapisispora phaffii CBS 4417]|uniref:Enhancer of mRNA-decapping protein 1 n=1 Tax=Tetrapisispora phaffii (strain ATCC 24235 / CBS 4417 / NBRC 1672 / NRRL Y-8282 / UCD 70-5) TaxID=1071381 RepID=G8BP34_TETPH|nr:hypothetical protein TPHA_0A05880 [Tetrapisispora phaffii CBS 4417]CCE61662.1 hypothetical protein TPHA_0A05880 [Tetrapisispora phaffii CBS 4417]